MKCARVFFLTLPAPVPFFSSRAPFPARQTEEGDGGDGGQAALSAVHGGGIWSPEACSSCHRRIPVRRWRRQQAEVLVLGVSSNTYVKNSRLLAPAQARGVCHIRSTTSVSLDTSAQRRDMAGSAGRISQDEPAKSPGMHGDACNVSDVTTEVCKCQQSLDMYYCTSPTYEKDVPGGLL